jgi:hypothetical protein
LVVTDENIPKRGRPALPPHLRKRNVSLLAVVPEEVALKVRAEADRRGCSYSHLVKSFIDSGMAALAEQQAA